MRKNKPVPRWKNDIKNPANREYVTEVAFNTGKSVGKVTQDEFNKRYGVKNDSIPSGKKTMTGRQLRDEANLIKLNQLIGKKKTTTKREANILKNAANAKKVAINKAKYKK